MKSLTCKLTVVISLLINGCFDNPDYTTSHGTAVYNMCDDVPTQADVEFYLDYMLEHGESCWPVDAKTMSWVLSMSKIIFTCSDFECYTGRCAGLQQFKKFSTRMFKHTVWWDQWIWNSAVYHELMHSFLFVLFDNADPGDPEYLPHDEVNYGEYWNGVHCLNKKIMLDMGVSWEDWVNGRV